MAKEMKTNNDWEKKLKPVLNALVKNCAYEPLSGRVAFDGESFDKFKEILSKLIAKETEKARREERERLSLLSKIANFFESLPEGGG